MNEHRTTITLTLALAGAILLAPAIASAAPDVSVIKWSPVAKRQYQVGLGPTGARGWVNGSRIEVAYVAPGSPAAGVLVSGDTIIGANGAAFAEGEDPRVALGNAIGESESAAKKGALMLTLSRNGKTAIVTVPLPVLGEFSPTWPADCAKSEKMLLNACRYLARQQFPDGHIQDETGMATSCAGLLWLASGESEFLDNARRAAYWIVDRQWGTKTPGLCNWPRGYGSLLLAEYYLATGDTAVLPELKLLCKKISDGQMPCGTWAHNSPWGVYGAVNQAGLPCFVALLLARDCGLQIDQTVIRKAMTFFRKYAGKGSVPYGDHRPGSGRTGAGKDALAALAFDLHGGEAENVKLFGMPVAESAPYREDGHTGSFFSITWGPVGAAYAGPEAFRKFLDEQKWYYNLSKTYEGGLYCQPNPENLTGRTPGCYTYDGARWTSGGIGLVFAMPQKKLRMFGAAPTAFGRKLKGNVETARTLFADKKWSELELLLGKLAKDNSLGAAEKKAASQFRAALDQQTASVNMAVATIGRLLELDDPYQAAELLAGLERLLGKDAIELADARAAIEANGGYWAPSGKEYYMAWSGLGDVADRYWQYYGRQAKASVATVGPTQMGAWDVLVYTSILTPQSWKQVTAPAEPTGWQTIGFDDAKWAALEGNPRNGLGWRGERILLRKSFDVTSLGYSRIRLRMVGLKSGSATVYLNGVKVAEIPRGPGKKPTPIDLDPAAAKLLRVGRNVLAVKANNPAGKGNSLDIGLHAGR